MPVYVIVVKDVGGVSLRYSGTILVNNLLRNNFVANFDRDKRMVWFRQLFVAVCVACCGESSDENNAYN